MEWRVWTAAPGRLLTSMPWLLVLGFAVNATLAAAKDTRPDPGIRFEIDRESYRVLVVDLASGQLGPEIPVAIGSPAHPTPAGRYRIRQVVREPRWSPGPTARAGGAEPMPASEEGPLGIAKIPISGAYALHGGADAIALGKPITLGCLRTTDDAITRLLDWLEARDALGAPRSNPAGERPQDFIRPVRFVIR